MSNKFTWGEGDVEHHGFQTKTGEIKWMKVGFIPDEFRQHGVVEMHVAINADTSEVFAGIHRLDRENLKPYALTYIPTGSEPVASVGIQFDSFEEAMKSANALLSEDGIEPHIVSPDRLSRLMLEEMYV